VCKIWGSPSAWTLDLGFPCPSGRAWSSDCGKFWAPLSVEMEFMQVWELRGSLTKQDGGQACKCARFSDLPGRQTWGSLVHPDRHGKCWVLVSTHTKFVQVGGFEIPLFGWARVCEVQGFIVHPDPSFRVPLFVRTDTIQV
jgi:hypothetical protein